MGINIEGLLVENESLDLAKIEEILEVKLQNAGNIPWEEAQTTQMGENEMMLAFKNNCAVLYFPLSFSRKNHNKLQKLLFSSKEGLMFACSETAMVFIFEWYTLNRKTGEDAYVFEEEFESHGENKLGLTENNDIIFDGLLSYIHRKTGLENDDDIAYYHFQPQQANTGIAAEKSAEHKPSQQSTITNKKWWQFWK